MADTTPLVVLGAGPGGHAAAFLADRSDGVRWSCIHDSRVRADDSVSPDATIVRATRSTKSSPPVTGRSVVGGGMQDPAPSSDLVLHLLKPTCPTCGMTEHCDRLQR